MLKRGVDPREVASKLHTTIEYVKKFTVKALDESAKKNEVKEDAARKHSEETRRAASALAGATKEILRQGPHATSEF